MKIIGIILASFAFAGVIVSPFFWLRFLREKQVAQYLVASSVGTLMLLFGYIYWLDTLISILLEKINAELYYFYDDFSLYPILIVVFLIILSPLIFVKIIQKKFTLKNFLWALLLTVALLVAIFIFLAFVLLPQAFNQLHNYL